MNGLMNYFTFFYKIFKFLEDHNQLFNQTEELSNKVRGFKVSITTQPNRVEEFRKKGGIGGKLVNWFEENME